MQGRLVSYDYSNTYSREGGTKVEHYVLDIIFVVFYIIKEKELPTAMTT